MKPLFYTTECSKCGGGTNQPYICQCGLNATRKRELDECKTIEEVAVWHDKYPYKYEALQRAFELGQANGFELGKVSLVTVY